MNICYGKLTELLFAFLHIVLARYLKMQLEKKATESYFSGNT